MIKIKSICKGFIAINVAGQIPVELPKEGSEFLFPSVELYKPFQSAVSALIAEGKIRIDDEIKVEEPKVEDKKPRERKPKEVPAE